MLQGVPRSFQEIAILVLRGRKEDEMSEEIKETPVEETAEAPVEETAEAPVEETAEAPAEKAAPAKEERSYEVSFESLGLTKPLDKMTAKELRALCVEKIPAIVGASGMAKEELVAKIKELFGIEDEEGGVSPYKDQILTLKGQIKELRVQKEKVEGRRERDIIRRKINKLKKRTRRLARAV